MEEISNESIQQILDENSKLLAVIMKCQNEGRIMDSILYQTRLQLNLVQLASIADNRPHPSVGPQAVKEIITSSTEATEEKLKLSKFIQTIRRVGLRDLELISTLTDIPIKEVRTLSTTYIEFLKRQNRNHEAEEYEEELSSSMMSQDIQSSNV
ncbi:SS18-like protein 2 [Histomonas meleagridis]|uniref:SS18-like protein 2 n=1 Tax=Histomonas meleagridis TaxID=135588 RepID=UPI003559D804|nr:SS18-like protein 2 [Histomonas meleagridis]KAH0801083.1 SS18-like protein 2 [Histomonas meleagridis]KAH0801089.1 SS18-like protein 2 [Histomonas meleagridis]